MKLALHLSYSGPRLELDLARILEAERLGFDSVWTAEAYGSDAVTPAAWIAARTERIHVGTAIMQIAARTPAIASRTRSPSSCATGERSRGGAARPIPTARRVPDSGCAGRRLSPAGR